MRVTQLWAALSTLSLLAGTVLLGQGVAAAAPQSAPATAKTPVALARQQSMASRHRVTVDALTTSRSLVTANPDGTFTTRLNSRPVRVRRGAGWVPVDTTLHRTGDEVAPAATTTLVRFSAGGRDPLVTISAAGGRIALTWPGPLPVPTVTGSTATYGNVLPGVDLRMTATEVGYTQAFVVRTAAAARQPALRRIRLGLRTNGLRLRRSAAGGRDAVARDGSVALTAQPARMWDAHRDHIAPVATGWGAGSVTLTPDAGLLADPHTTYPVTIDPDFTAPTPAWTKVLSGHSTQSYWYGGPDDAIAKVGLCYPSYDCHGIGIARSFFQYDLTRLAGYHADVLGATFSAHEIHAPSCTPTRVDLYTTGAISPATTYANQPGRTYISSVTAAHGHDGCGPDSIGFAVGKQVGEQVGSKRITFELAAHDEGDGLSWKKFDPNPTLTVNYNIPPSTPTGLSNQGLGCASGSNVTWVRTATPSLRATVHDADGENVHAEFEWFVRNGPLIGYVTTGATSAGNPISVTIPTGQLHDGSAIYWRVRTLDAHTEGPFSGWCNLTVDETAPGAPPGVSSTIYPPDRFGGGVGVAGTFTFTAGGVADVAGYRYGQTEDPQNYVAAATLGGSASAVVTPTRYGPQSLWVRSVDRAGNVSDPPVRYDFAVSAGTPPAAYWPLDGFDTTATALDHGPGHHDLTVSGLGAGTSWTTGQHRDALQVNGTAGSYATAAGGPIVDTTHSFSVSAWVRLDAADSAEHAAVSQDGTNVFGFFLGYVGDQHRYTFRMVSADSDQVATTRASAATAPTPGTWTHLVGTFESASRTLTLYVNGAAAGTATLAATWHSGGNLQIGRARYSGVEKDGWAGGIDDVRVYDRVLAPGETSGTTDNVHDLATGPTVEQVSYPLDDAAGTTATDRAGTLHPAALGGDATWASGVVGAGAVHLGGTGSLATRGPVVRTDNSLTVAAWVLLDHADGAEHVALSQDGASSSGFSLRYNGGTHSWNFTVTNTDANPTVATSAADPATADEGEWTHLVGVQDVAAGQLRLYVNGAPAGTAPLTGARWNAAGALEIGRGRTGGSPSGYWTGSVDDVHVYSGAFTDEQVVDLETRPVVTPSTPYGGQFTRWLGHANNHLTSATGLVPPDFHIGVALGLPAPASASDTRVLYSCLIGTNDPFTSIDPNCEGQQKLGQLGLVYANVDDAPNLVGLYRCLTKNTPTFHYDSTSATCEGQTVEGLLGYVVAQRGLIRYNSAPRLDHYTTVLTVPADYDIEGSLGTISAQPLTGTVALYSCTTGADHFSSTAADCGGNGAQVVDLLGYVWQQPPPDVQETGELTSCVITDTGEHFDSLDPHCEGQSTVDRLGYTVLQP